MMRRFICLLCALFMGGLLLAGSAGALDQADLTEIRRAIQEKGAKWEAADNPIFRLSREEQRRLCGAILESPQELKDHIKPYSGPKRMLPQELDWRDVDGINWITPIRNQTSCGSCVIFGTIATFEGRLGIYSNRPSQDLDLSEQHVFSCGGGSCDGGWYTGAACDYLQLYGAPMESCLPYVAVDDNCDETCTDWDQQVRKISDWGEISSSGTQQEVVERLKTHLMDGPIIVSYTVYDDFMGYSSGVYQHVWGQNAGGHCVSIVGWNDADSCWICKNSWGPGWGEDGFFRIRMGHDEVGIESDAKWLIPEPIHSAYVEITDYSILDEATGDGDGNPDPGEAFDLSVTLSNAPTWGYLTDVQGWLLSTDPRVTLTDVTASYPDLPDGSTATNVEDHFAITLAEQTEITPISFTLYITGTCEGAYPYSAELQFELPIVASHSGWPMETAASVRCSPLMAWNYGGPRRLVAVEDNGTLHLWEHDGQEAPGFPFQAPGGQIWGSVAMADLDGDDRDEILFGSKSDTLYALHRNGTLLFKRDMGADILATPAVADLDADGSPEIVLGTMASELHILTALGQKYFPSPIILGGPVMADAALADLDEDGKLDIVVGASNGMLYAISGETGEALPGFPFATGGAIWSSPVIADLNYDGEKEIIFGSDDTNLYVVTLSGTLLFSYPTGGSIRCSPAVADLNSSNKLDIIFTSQDHKVYAVSYQGNTISGWPYDTGKALWTSPIVADIDEDGFLEVVLEVPNSGLIHLEANGSLLLTLPIHSSGIAMSTPVVGDLDNNGDLEIAVGAPNGIHIWSYPAASDVDIPWPMYRGNARRTGYIGDITTGRPESPAEPTVPVKYALWQNYPNPFNPETTIRYSLAQEGPVRLSIFNITGQEVITLVDGHQTAGFHNATWVGVDARGNRVSSGLYFCRLQAGEFTETKKMVLLR